MTQFLSSFFQILGFLLGVTFAAPLTHKQKGSLFTVRDYLPHGPTALNRAYRKFNITPTSLGLDVTEFEFVEPCHRNGTVSQTASSPSEGGVPVTSVQNGALFVAPVTIGGQTLMMDFDTGSSDL
jgi:hypothetical protein